MNLKQRLDRLARTRQELPPLVICPILSTEEIHKIKRESKERYGLESLIIMYDPMPNPDEKKATEKG